MRNILFLCLLSFLVFSSCGGDDVSSPVDSQVDSDGDGYNVNDDCDDTNAEIYPGSTEICGNGIDENCKSGDDDCVLGSTRDGGVVFWLDPADSTHGLVCTFSDVAMSAKLEWGCFGTDLPNVPNVSFVGGIPLGLGSEIGDGFSNTNSILNDCPTAPAALACRSLGPEWFLPSINELNEMHKNKEILEAVPGFTWFGATVFYWSSTEVNSGNAWKQDFVQSVGAQDFRSKNSKDNYVRAVRAF